MSREAFALLVCACAAHATVVSTIHGVVHDPAHRPIPAANVSIQAQQSQFSVTVETDARGEFTSPPLAQGEYRIEVSRAGFESEAENVAVSAESSPVLHFQLPLEHASGSVTVTESAVEVNAESMTPTTVVTRAEIAETPGADLSNSMSMITDYVPGAWMTHDQLHVRGGHQVTWAIDGVPIPNTNIASNVGPQIDPKDVDFLEADRGGYSAASGDRTYGVFDVTPRTGFERDNEAELYVTGGSFYQTNDQFNFGGHTEKFAYFASINGNRSDYGLMTPGPDVIHDQDWGLGGMATLLYNADSANQFRFVATLRRDDYQIPNLPGQQSADMEQEHDAVLIGSWIRTLAPGALLTVSPFFHDNLANYSGSPDDFPLSTSQHRTSNYFGGQATIQDQTQHNSLTAGLYAFGQHDDEFVQIVGNNGSGSAMGALTSTGQIEALFAEDQWKPVRWFTVNVGARFTHFDGALTENALTPRLGGALVIPRLHWILRGFWGTYYQAPPLSTVAGPLAQYAAVQGLGFIPLHGERDQEHQFGLTIPLRGWSADINDYHQRAHNYFDHNNIGDSDVFFPLTVDHARLYGWEFAIRSPRLFQRAETYIAYAYAHAEGAGGISGGLTDFSPPGEGYFLLDHDQRHTLHWGVNARLPRGVSAASNLYYGSGFTDGSLPYPGHLEAHAAFDLTLGKSLGESASLSVTALNLANRRFLLDNSLTFGGTHYADPRQIYAQFRYRFKFLR